MAPMAASADELEDFAAKVKPSVVMLKAVDASGERIGNGTGFLISADGFVVTNDHVVEADPTVAVLADGSERKILGLLATDKDADVAIIRIEGSGYSPLPLGDTSKVAVGARVVVVGNPMGLDQTLSEGVVSALLPKGLGKDMHADSMAKAPLVQITAPIAPGSSGSPVLTRDGMVIGVAQSVFLVGNLNFAVAIEKVKELQARAPTNGELTKLRPLPMRNLIISGVFFAVLAVWVVSRRLGKRT
jgi:serine protease Do